MLVSQVLARAVPCGVAVSMLLGGAELRVRLSVGQSSAKAAPFYVRVLPGSPSSKIDRFQTVNAEHGRTATQSAWIGTAGAGKIASLTFDLVYPDDPVNNARPINIMWADLINHSDADSAARLSRDAENEVASGAVKVLLGSDQPHGCFDEMKSRV